MKKTNLELLEKFTEIDQTIRKLLFLRDKSSDVITSLMASVNWDKIIDKKVKDYSEETEKFIHHLKNEAERISTKIKDTTPEDLQETSEKVKGKIDHLAQDFNKEVKDYLNGEDVQLKVDNLKSKAYLKSLEAEMRFKTSLAQLGESFRAWKDALELKKQHLQEDNE